MRKFAIFIILIIVISIGIPSAFVLKKGVYKKPVPEDLATVSVYIKNEDKVVDMPKGQYLKEVVSAEMPASFEVEALKAQAVAARSYLEARLTAYQANGTPEEHKGADICTDFAHCKAWISEEKRRELWGGDADKNWDKISRAVNETADEVIFSDGNIISAVFHSTSSGRTESSKDVWGGERTYLTSVESPGEEAAPNFKSDKTISLDEFKNIVKEKIDGVNLDAELIGEISRSEAGGIITINIGTIPVKGTEFRTMFDLKSTNVNIDIGENDIHFDVTGYGHGVGMSQYGANAMAKNGKNYVEILSHYYQGTSVGKK